MMDKHGKHTGGKSTIIQPFLYETAFIILLLLNLLNKKYVLDENKNQTGGLGIMEMQIPATLQQINLSPVSIAPVAKPY